MNTIPATKKIYCVRYSTRSSFDSTVSLLSWLVLRSGVLREMPQQRGFLSSLDSCLTLARLTDTYSVAPPPPRPPRVPLTPPLSLTCGYQPQQGIQRAVSTLVNILLRLAPFFFIFSAGTNAHYVNSAVMTGQAKYQATGRGFVIAHVRATILIPFLMLRRTVYYCNVARHCKHVCLCVCVVIIIYLFLSLFLFFCYCCYYCFCFYYCYFCYYYGSLLGVWWVGCLQHIPHIFILKYGV